MKKVTGIFIWAIFFVFAGNAQPMSLQQAIDSALKNSFDLRIQRNNVKINAINNDHALAGAYPTVTAGLANQESINNLNQELGTGSKIQRNGNLTNNLNASINGSITLYNGYRIVATEKRLKELEQQSLVKLNALIQTKIAGVMIQYFDIIRKQEQLKTTLASIELSKKSLEIIESRKSVGLANDADIFQASIDLNTRKQLLESQQTDLQSTKIYFLNFLNMQTDAVIELTDSLDVNEGIVLSDVLTKLNKTPGLAELESQIKINELLEKELSALRKPVLMAGAGFNFGRVQNKAGQLLLNQNYGPFFGLNLSIPIFNGNQIKKQIQIATIKNENTKLEKEQFLNGAEANVIQYYQQYNSAIRQWKIQYATQELSSKLMNLILSKYELNAATSLQVREAQKSYEETAYRLTELKYLAKVAEIQLFLLSGELK